MNVRPRRPNLSRLCQLMSVLILFPSVKRGNFMYTNRVSSQYFGVRQKLRFSWSRIFATMIQKLSFSLLSKGKFVLCIQTDIKKLTQRM